MSLFDSDVSEFLSYSKRARRFALAYLRDQLGDHVEADGRARDRQRRCDCGSCQSRPPRRLVSPETRAQEMGPNALQSAGPTDEAIATSGQVNDASVVQDSGGVRKERFDYVHRCPLCTERLQANGSCLRCKVQFVGIEQKVADRVDFTLTKTEEAGHGVIPTYRSFWEKDNAGCAIMCFQSRATGWRVWIPCFINYRDPLSDKQNSLPYWFKPQRFDARTVQTLADLTDEQFKERAAHIPGRTSEHMRQYDTDAFQRHYYWLFMDTPETQWQTRVQRKDIILHRLRKAGCESDCSKCHRPRAR